MSEISIKVRDYYGNGCEWEYCPNCQIPGLFFNNDLCSRCDEIITLDKYPPGVIHITQDNAASVIAEKGGCMFELSITGLKSFLIENKYEDIANQIQDNWCWTGLGEFAKTIC